MAYFDIEVYSRTITASKGKTQRWFDRGLVWTFAYCHDEAVKCFTKALNTYESPAVASTWSSLFSARNLTLPLIMKPICVARWENLVGEK